MRNDHVAFLDANKRFLDNVFFPELASNDVKHVIHLGDLVDRRKFINFNTATRLRQDFLEPLSLKNITVDIIAGNHDTYYKNTNEVNALRELVGRRRGDDRDRPYDGLKVLLLPWICDGNREESLNAIKTTRAQVVMGHLELQGFEMYRGSMVSHGDDPSIFERFDLVCSGHYHHRSTNGHICYLGSHAEFTWSDYDDPRGFHIFDTETRELTFIQNPYKMFKKIWYDDSDTNFVNSDINYSEYKNTIVKVVVKAKNNPYWFDMFIDNLEKAGTIDLQVVEDHLNLNLEDDTDIVNEAEDTITIFRS